MASILGRILNRWTPLLKPADRISRISRPAANLALVFGIVSAKQSLTNTTEAESRPKIAVTDPERLTYSYLIKQAASHTVDAATTVLTQTAVAILEHERKYREELRKLIKLMEYHRETICNNEEDTTVWDQIVALRSESETIKKKIGEMEVFLKSVTQLMVAAAETAFHADCEYGSVAASERLQSATSELEFSKEKSKEVEKKYLDSYSKIIQDSGKQKNDENNKGANNKGAKGADVGVMNEELEDTVRACDI